MCGVTDPFHMQLQPTAKQDHSFHISSQVWEKPFRFWCPLVNKDKQFVWHRSPATKPSKAGPRASLQILQPPPAASQFFTRPSLRWQWLRLSGRGVSQQAASLNRPSPPPTDSSVTASHFFTRPIEKLETEPLREAIGWISPSKHILLDISSVFKVCW